MQPIKLYFDVRDIFRAPRLALSGKKIIVFIQANLIGYFAYWIFNYLGAMVHGVSFSDTWSMYGLYPCLLTIESLPLLPCILFWAGIVFWFFAISLGSTAVSRVTYCQLKGDEFYSGSDAWNYVKRHWHPIIYSSISLLLILVFLFVVAGILGLIGKIPYVGEFLFVLPYLLYFFGSVFTIYTGIVLLVSLIYTPSIVATYEEDTMGTVWHNFSITWGQPWRMISYHFVLLPLLLIGGYLFSHFWMIGYSLINNVFGHDWLMGTKLMNIVGWASQAVHPEALCSLIGNNCSVCNVCSTGCLSCGSILSASAMNVTGTEQIAAFILAIFLFLIMVSAVSYTMSIFAVGETLMFIILKNRTDNDNILEKNDEDDVDDEDSDSEITNDEFVQENDEDIDSDDKGKKD
tara:strand:- start:3 stop:1214 length:1212 start_codon:yes stop_codon:yes gene_type:complete